MLDINDNSKDTAEQVSSSVTPTYNTQHIKPETVHDTFPESSAIPRNNYDTVSHPHNLMPTDNATPNQNFTTISRLPNPISALPNLPNIQFNTHPHMQNFTALRPMGQSMNFAANPHIENPMLGPRPNMNFTLQSHGYPTPASSDRILNEETAAPYQHRTLLMPPFNYRPYN